VVNLTWQQIQITAEKRVKKKELMDLFEMILPFFFAELWKSDRYLSNQSKDDDE